MSATVSTKEPKVLQPVTMAQVKLAKAAGKKQAAAQKKQAAPKKQAAAPERAERKARAPGVGALTKELIMQGKTNDEVVAELMKKFPDKANSVSNVNWYRNKLRQDGANVPQLARKKKA